MPGSVNGGFNSKKKSWQTKKKQHAREVKKRKGASTTHKIAVAAVSGKRTKKAARKATHRAAVSGKEQAALETAMQIETNEVPSAASPALKKPAARKFGKKKGAGGKGKGKPATAAAAAAPAAAAPDAMQE